MQSEQLQRCLGGLDAVVAGPERQVVQELVDAKLQRGPVVVGDGEEVDRGLSLLLIPRTGRAETAWRGMSTLVLSRFAALMAPWAPAGSTSCW